MFFVNKIFATSPWIKLLFNVLSVGYNIQIEYKSKQVFEETFFSHVLSFFNIGLKTSEQKYLFAYFWRTFFLSLHDTNYYIREILNS